MKSLQFKEEYIAKEEANFGLHPLVHTWPNLNLAQDIDSIDKRSRNSSADAL